jgi:hypothetical protein
MPSSALSAGMSPLGSCTVRRRSTLLLSHGVPPFLCVCDSNVPQSQRPQEMTAPSANCSLSGDWGQSTGGFRLIHDAEAPSFRGGAGPGHETAGAIAVNGSCRAPGA